VNFKGNTFERSEAMTEADSGKTVDVPVGGNLELSLNENATTGYRWEIENVNTRIVEVKDGEYKPSSGGVGGGGSKHWSLKAIAPGKTECQLKLWRPWEGDSSIQKRFSVTLVVH